MFDLDGKKIIEKKTNASLCTKIKDHFVLLRLTDVLNSKNDCVFNAVKGIKKLDRDNILKISERNLNFKF